MWFFCKIKIYDRAGRASITGRGYGSSTTRYWSSPQLPTPHSPSCFFSLSLMPPPPRHPFSAEGVGAGASSPYSSDTSPDTDPHSGYCTSTRMFHSMRAPLFLPLDVVCLPALHPILPPHPVAPAHGRSHEPTDARRRGYGASRSCSWPFSVHAAEEDTVVPATLRLSWRWGI
jgi:hypothetical protein